MAACCSQRSASWHPSSRRGWKANNGPNDERQNQTGERDKKMRMKNGKHKQVRVCFGQRRGRRRCHQLALGYFSILVISRPTSESSARQTQANLVFILATSS